MSDLNPNMTKLEHTLYHLFTIRFLASGLLISMIGGMASSCDDSDSSGSSNADLIYDLEGPRGIIRGPGPWLVRLGVPAGTPAERCSLSLSGEETTQVQKINFIESGRPDTLFALIPEFPSEVEVSYHLEVNGQMLSDVYQFKHVPLVTQIEPNTSLGCVIRLDAPDPNLPIRQEDDRAPEAGIQRHYEVSVYPTREGQISFEEAQYVGGLVTFHWLSVVDDAEVGPSMLVPLLNGQARSKPLTTSLGIQRLRVRAITERGARCGEIFEFQSF